MGGRGGGGEEETLRNNLSVPVVFAEGHGITGLPVGTDTGLRPRPAMPIIAAFAARHPGVRIAFSLVSWTLAATPGTEVRIEATQPRCGRVVSTVSLA